MSFFEDLFEGRKRGHHGGHDHDNDWDRHDYGRDPLTRPANSSGPQVACGGCRTPVVVLPGFRFCPYCGGPLATSSTCPGCGIVRAAGAAFCPGCGTRY
jgi:hypothetical protein